MRPRGNRRDPADRWPALAYRFSVCFVVAFLATGSAAASEFTFGVKGWYGGPVFVKGSGAFDQCLMHTKYDNGMVLVLGITVEGSLTITIINPLWKLNPEQKFDVGVAIDERHLGAHIAVATDTTRVFILMKYSDDLIQRFHEGESLRIITRKETLGFRLLGVRHAMPRLQQCVYEEMLKDSTGRQQLAAGIPRRGQLLASPQSANALNDESTVSTLMYRAGLDGFRFLPLEEREDSLFGQAIYAWSDDIITGGLYILSGRKTNQPAMASLFLASFNRACTGEFSYALVPRRLADGARASRVTGQCSASRSRFTLAISLFPLKESLAVVVHMGPAGAETETARADAAIYGFFTDD